MSKKVVREKFGSKRDLLIVSIISIYVVINIKLIFINNELLASGKEEAVVNVEGLHIFKIFMASTIILFGVLILFKYIPRYTKRNKSNKDNKGNKKSKSKNSIERNRNVNINNTLNERKEHTREINIKTNAS